MWEHFMNLFPPLQFIGIVENSLHCDPIAVSHHQALQGVASSHTKIAFFVDSFLKVWHPRQLPSLSVWTVPGSAGQRCQGSHGNLEVSKSKKQS